MTGRHPARVRITNFIGGERRGLLLPAEYLRSLPEERVKVPELLRDAGYATGVFGKWHLGPPADIPRHGFAATGSTTVSPGLGPADDPMHARAIAMQAADFIAANRDRSFLCYVPMHSVHVPLAAVETNGLAGDTVVVFTSDNGGLTTARGGGDAHAEPRTGRPVRPERTTAKPLTPGQIG